ncbi:unnamed protein product, partial [Amoebophrya sp. A25]|eukprot:GSA25T00011047001.1
MLQKHRASFALAAPDVKRETPMTLSDLGVVAHSRRGSMMVPDRRGSVSSRRNSFQTTLKGAVDE